MPRAKTVVPGRARRRKILKAAKGNFSGRRKLYKTALQTVQRAGQFAYEHRRLKKRDFRRLWITRINAAARTEGLSYSTLIAGLKRANIDVNRKLLADLAVRDMAAFAMLAKAAKSANPDTTASTTRAATSGISASPAKKSVKPAKAATA